MLHYNPQLVSSSTMLIFRIPLSIGVMYSRLQTMTIPDAVMIQYDLLKMSIVLLETC